MQLITRAVVWPEPDLPVVKSPKSLAREFPIPTQHPRSPAPTWTDAAPGKDGLLFPAVESGGHMKRGALYKVYRRARKAAGRPDLPVARPPADRRHPRRPSTGANLAELVNRLGHTTVSAALIYQPAAAGRDAEIARRLSAIASAGEGFTAA